MINLENYLIPVMEASDDAFITGEYIPEMANNIFNIIKPGLPSSGWDIVNFTYDARDYSSTFNFTNNNGSYVNGLLSDKVKKSLGSASLKIKSIMQTYRNKLRDSDKWIKVYIKYEKDGRFNVRFSYEN